MLKEIYELHFELQNLKIDLLDKDSVRLSEIKESQIINQQKNEHRRNFFRGISGATWMRQFGGLTLGGLGFYYGQPLLNVILRHGPNILPVLPNPTELTNSLTNRNMVN